MLYGFLLGKSFIFLKNKDDDAYARPKAQKAGDIDIQIILKIEDKHISYMLEVYNRILNLGYCEPYFPKIEKKLCKKGKLVKQMLLQTYYNKAGGAACCRGAEAATLAKGGGAPDYLKLYQNWYEDPLNPLARSGTVTDRGKGKNKKLPNDFTTYFNEESLAYWLMTEGQIKNKSLYVNINDFNAQDIQYLIKILEGKFKLENIKLNNNYLKFNSNNIKKIYCIIKPYLVPSMKFKFIS